MINRNMNFKKEIMKKYIKPSMDIVKLENVSLLAASGSGNEVNTTLSNDTPMMFHSILVNSASGTAPKSNELIYII